MANTIKFIEILKKAWDRLPPEIKVEVDGNSKIEKTKRSGTKRKATEPLDRPHTKVIAAKEKVSQSLEINLDSWMESPLSFFVDAPNPKFDLEQNPLAQSYNFLLHLESHREIDLIRARFLKVVFHHLKERLSLCYVRSDNLQRLAQIILRSGLVESSLGTIKEGLRGWIIEGGRIDSLCKDMNGSSFAGCKYLGILFYLPAHVNSEL